MNMASLSEQIAQTFQVEGVPTVTVGNTRGNVRVMVGETSQVVVNVRKSATANRDDEVQRMLENIVIEMSQNGDQIQIETRLPNHCSHLKWMSKGDNWRIDMDVTVPAATNLRLALNAGNASIRDTTGALDVRLNSGNLEAHDLHVTDHGAWHMNSGNLMLEQVALEGPTRFEINSGRVTLHAVTFGAEAEMKSNSGDIRGDVALGEGAHLHLALNARATCGWNCPRPPLPIWMPR